MKKNFKNIGILLVILGIAISGYSQNDIPERPSPPKLVNDFTQTLSRNEVRSLEQKLANFARNTSTQIAIAIVPSFNGYDLVEFTERLSEKWGVGQKGDNNGVMIVIRPKSRQANGRVHIAVGYGLDGVIPDAIAKRIIENEMIPSFKRNDYFGALNKSTNVLISLSAGEFTSDEYNQRTQGNRFGFLVPLFAIIFFFFMSRMSGRRGRTVGSSSLPLWTLLFMGSSMGRGSHHGSWNSFSGGTDSFGGGFGGFGGGGFGGGGASGSW